jgi:hypothetical protein
MDSLADGGPCQQGETEGTTARHELGLVIVTPSRGCTLVNVLVREFVCG